MSFLSSILLNLVKSDQVYVILGGSSASNNNTFFNYTSRENVYSFDFDNNSWKTAVNPMPGGEGNGSSIWPVLGTLLYQSNSSIYFYDCARIGAQIQDWAVMGEYFNLATDCLTNASKFIKTNKIENYNVIWQEGPQDNYYSFNSNFFIDTINNLITKSDANSNWFLSIYTYGNYNTGYRNAKLEDIVVLTQLHDNVYLGANFDKNCLGYSPFNKLQIINAADLWYNSLIIKAQTDYVFNIYYQCVGGFDFSSLLFYFGLIFMAISFTCGSIYAFRYYQRRKVYLRLQNN